jgi:hypothetical protein
MSRHILFSSALVVCCSGFVLLGVAADDQAVTENIDDLHSQKLSLLEDIAARYQFGYATGKPVLEELLAAKHALLEARLSMADQQADRVKLHELIVENRARLVEARAAGHQLGKNAEVDILAARVEHIDAKIALQQERSKAERSQ